MKNVLIFDLDNTIYPVKSIGDRLFAPLLELMDQYRHQLSDSDFENAREDIMRKPFQKVAETWNFSRELTDKGINLLRNIEYNDEIRPFDDYVFTIDLPGDKYLVTTGFTRLQRSKIRNLGVEKHFNEIYIIDPDTSGLTKKDIFLEIIRKHAYRPGEVLVIGDDPDSEIQAAQSLEIDTFLYDPDDVYPQHTATFKGKSFRDLRTIAGK